MKVKFMIATLILVAFCFTAGAQKNKMPDSDAPAAKSGKPNIVVIMADDINWSNKHVKYEENQIEYITDCVGSCQFHNQCSTNQQQ